MTTACPARPRTSSRRTSPARTRRTTRVRRNERRHHVLRRSLPAFAGWWLARQRLTAKPWLEQGVIEGVPDFEASHDPAKRAGLGFFLAVVGSLFALLTGAYFMRRELGDWQPLPVPPILWFNTGVLVLSAASRCEWAQRAVRRGDQTQLRVGLAVAAPVRPGLPRRPAHRLAGAFRRRLLCRRQPGQQLLLPRHRAARPAHARRPRGAGLGHASRPGAGDRSSSVRLNVELCATYWHVHAVRLDGVCSACSPAGPASSSHSASNS